VDYWPQAMKNALRLLKNRRTAPDCRERAHDCAQVAACGQDGAKRQIAASDSIFLI
jgi:hypothetical protein